MTEAEWLKSTDVEKMVAALRRGRAASSRKYRLFGCACCRAIWDLLDDTTRSGVEAAEHLDDGTITAPAFRAVADRVWIGTEAVPQLRPVYRAVTALLAPEMTHKAALDVARLVGTEAHRTTGALTTRLAQTGLLRDLFGPLLFRPGAVLPAWQTSTVAALAAGIYAETAVDRAPILADALADAGCDDADLLGHLRGPGPHVRGCWAVDRVLGRT